MYTEADIRNWEDIKSKLKIIYPGLTGADLLWRHSSIEDLIGAIADKLGKTHRELTEEIEKYGLTQYR